MRILVLSERKRQLDGTRWFRAGKSIRYAKTGFEVPPLKIFIIVH